MAEYDNKAFDAMKSATKSKASNLFTESEYNAFATDKDRAGYDKRAFDVLKEMYETDNAKYKFRDIDFKKYIGLLKPELFEERVFSYEGDQKSGDFFGNIYERDFDQFRASALRGMPEKQGLRLGPGPEESPSLREALRHKGGIERSEKIESGIEKYPELFKDYKKF